ncbi:Bacterial type II secretion system protein F domain protein [compost metagenome]
MILDTLIYILVFAAAAIGSLALIQTVSGLLRTQRRLGEGTAAANAAGPVLRADAVGSSFMMWVQRSSSLSDGDGRRKLRHRLSLVGIEHPAGPIWYVMGRFALAIGLPLVFLAAQKFVAQPAPLLLLILVSLALCGVGLVLPHMILNNRIRARQQAMEQEFPDVLDLTVVCIEAGLGLEAAFVRVGQEISQSHPRMADAYGRVSQQLRAGQSRAEALRGMAQRADVDGVRSFVTLLIQSDVLGASIAQTLRSYAVEMRANRFHVAEEKAMRIPVLMTIPLVACILPVVVFALLLPPIIDVIRELGPALAGRGRG